MTRTRRRLTLLSLLVVTAWPARLAAQCPDGTPPPCGRRPPPDSNLLAITPFAVTGPAGLQYLGHGVMDLLGYALDDFAGWRIADTRHVVARLPSGAAAADPRAVAAAMRALGATRVVTGRAVILGAEVRIHAELLDTRDGRRLLVADARARSDAPEAAVDSIAALLGRDRAQARVGRRYPLTELLSGSPEAVRSLLVGEELLRRRQPEAAMDTLLHAIRLDSTLGMAYYVMYAASTHGGLTVGGWDGRRIAAEGLRFQSRMTARSSGMLRVALGLQEGRWQETIATAEELARAYPEDPGIAGLLADTYFHVGLRNGVSPERTLAALERAIALDPGFTEALHVLQLRLQRGDTTGVGGPMSNAALRAAARMFVIGIDPVLEASAIEASADGGTMDWPQQMLMVIGDHDPARAIALADSFAAALAARPEFATPLRAFLVGTRAAYRMATGRDREAHEQLRAAQALGGTPIRRIALAAVRPGIWTTDSATVAQGTAATMRRGAIGNELVLAWYAAARGDTALFAQLDHAIDSTLTARHEAMYLRSLLEGTRGLLALALGDSAGARRLLAAAWEGLSYVPLEFPASALDPQCALVLARLDVAAGAPDLAERRLHRTFWTGYLFRAEAEEMRGEIAEQRGDTAAAISAYRTFVALWKDADPELQPRVARAREALARLSAR